MTVSPLKELARSTGVSDRLQTQTKDLVNLFFDPPQRLNSTYKNPEVASADPVLQEGGQGEVLATHLQKNIYTNVSHAPTCLEIRHEGGIL